MTNRYDPNATLPVNVEGIGSFIFKMRTIQNQFRIEVEYAKLTEGVAEVTTFLGNLAEHVADLSCLILSGPPGWSADDIMKMDAFDTETYVKIEQVWSALRDKETSFRGFAEAPTTGEGDERPTGDVVSPEVQPPAE